MTTVGSQRLKVEQGDETSQEGVADYCVAGDSESVEFPYRQGFLLRLRLSVSVPEDLPGVPDKTGCLDFLSKPR